MSIFYRPMTMCFWTSSHRVDAMTTLTIADAIDDGRQYS